EGIALPTATFSAATAGRFKARAGAGPQVMSLKSVKLSSQGSQSGVASAAVRRPESSRVQGLRSAIDDPLPHAASPPMPRPLAGEAREGAGASDCAANAAWIGARPGPR